MIHEERKLFRGFRYGMIGALLFWLSVWLVACVLGPPPMDPLEQIIDSEPVSMEQALEPPLTDRAMELVTTDDAVAVQGRVRELYGPTACSGYRGVNPYIVAQPRPRAGEPWICAFLTSASPVPPEPDWPMWIIVGAKLEQPIDFTPFGMKGCWLHVRTDNIVFVPAGSKGSMTLQRSGGRVTLHWLIPTVMHGKIVCFQLMTLSPSGFVSSHAIEVLIGS